jgi:hypothetical protein
MASQSVPYTTGNELLSYKGDAGLAAGTNPRGILPQQGDPFAGIGSTIDQLNGELMQQKLFDYKQKAAAQEQLAQTLAATGGSVFNTKDPATGQNMSFTPLPDDQKILDQKASDLRDTILQNPDKYMYDRDYLSAKREYDNLVNHAGVRSVAYSKYNLEANQSQDPQERQDIMAQRNHEVNNYKLTDFHMPEPHLADIPVTDSIDENQFKDPKTHENFGTTINNVKGVDYEFKKHGIPNAIVYAPLSDFSTKGLVNASKYMQQFQRSPVSKDPAYIASMNAKIDQNAADRGAKPVYAATINPDGTINYNNNPGQVLTALNLEKHGWVQTDQDPTDAKRKQEQEKAQTAKDYAEAQKALRDKSNHPPTAEELKEQRERQMGYNTYKEVQNVYNPANYTAKDKISTSPLLMGVFGPTRAVVQTVKDAGYSPDEYDYYNVPKSASKYIGIPAPVTTEESTVVPDPDNKGNKTVTKTTTPQRISESADKTVMVRNKQTGVGHLLYLKNGSVVANVTQRDAIENGLKHDNRYDEKVYANPAAYGQQFYDQEVAGQTPAPPAQNTTPNAPASQPGAKPQSVPSTAVLKTTKSGMQVWVDKSSKKLYNSEGQEIQIK